MKLSIFLILLTFLLSCKEDKKYWSLHGITLDSLKKQELSTGVVNDTIVLGFRFGMTEKEVERHLRQLLKDKIIYEVDRTYAYDIVISESSLSKRNVANFNMEYFHGELFKITLYATPENDYGQSSKQLLSFDLQKLYDEKYGRFDYTDEILDRIKFVWINGNLMISVFPAISSCNITYTDLVREQLQVREEKTRIDSAAKSTKKAL